ncbi:cupin domain-containing protein [Bdellovibrio sp. ArHS]|uniref:JmjC domain-containing protein n=1 Tax=Bdellovibrio sp. ArHS TaxID=1569284 RepID=UPI000A674948|nr:cupin domain-containing protein [Bdellovibrio sp. ArHS]
MKAPKSPAPVLKPTLLDTPFWRNFAKKHWEKAPLTLRNVKTGLSEMSAEEIFNLLVLYSDRCRKLQDPEGFKFYIDGFKVDASDVLQVLPVKKDQSLQGYHKRMQAEFSDYCLVCDELLKVNLKKQHLLTDFTDELYRHVGLPNRFSEMGLYLGNYRKTPFGVHVDACGVFSFPVAGTKKFRLWTAEFGKKNPGLDRSFKYDKYKKNSLLIEARPGDMVYWPSSAWHIAESDGSFSATWSLGVWVDQPLKNDIAASLKELIDTQLGTTGEAPTTAFTSLHSSSGEVTELPLAYQNSIEMIRHWTAGELQETFLKSWMKHISLQGFKNLPKMNLPLSENSEIKLRSDRSLILWNQSQTNKNIFYFCFGGVLIESSKGSGLLPLVKKLNAGHTCAVKTLLKGRSGKKNLDALHLLAEAGAFSF